MILKDTHKEKALSNITQALTKSMNMNIWIKSTLYKRFLNRNKILKKKVVTGKTPFFVIGPFCTHNSICLNIDFSYDSFVWK